MVPLAPRGGAVEGAGGGGKAPHRADSAVDIPPTSSTGNDGDTANGAARGDLAARAACLQRACAAAPRRPQRRAKEEEEEGACRAARALKALVFISLVAAMITTALVFNAGAPATPRVWRGAGAWRAARTGRRGRRGAAGAAQNPNHTLLCARAPRPCFSGVPVAALQRTRRTSAPSTPATAPRCRAWRRRWTWP
jgi:hypothetical protein